MHIEKKNYNIFNTLMNVKGKTKDNVKSREDLKEFCHCPELHLDENANKYFKVCSYLRKSVATPEPGPTRMASLNRNPGTLGLFPMLLNFLFSKIPRPESPARPEW